MKSILLLSGVVLLSGIGGVYISSPIVALIPAILFGLIFFKIRGKLIGVTAILWLLYSIYETLMFLRITCSGDCNIRVDLLLIYPLLIIFTAGALSQIREKIIITVKNSEK